jgi:hypothetical protein
LDCDSIISEKKSVDRSSTYLQFFSLSRFTQYPI